MKYLNWLPFFFAGGFAALVYFSRPIGWQHVTLAFVFGTVSSAFGINTMLEEQSKHIRMLEARLEMKKRTATRLRVVK